MPRSGGEGCCKGGADSAHFQRYPNRSDAHKIVSAPEHLESGGDDEHVRPQDFQLVPIAGNWDEQACGQEQLKFEKTAPQCDHFRDQKHGKAALRHEHVGYLLLASSVEQGCLDELQFQQAK